MSIIDDAKQLAQGAAQAAMAKAVALAPDSWMPGGTPDPLIRHQHGHIGKPLSRIDGPLKVRGAAPFAAEFPIEGMVYAALAYSTIAKGRIVELDTAAAEAAPGVVAGDDAPQRAADEAAAVFLTAAKAAGGDDLPDHAGRPHPLERPADRRGARRDAGAGRSRQVADPRDLRGRGGAHRVRARPRPRGTRAGHVHGRAAHRRSRRCGGGAGGRAAQGRRDLSHAAPQPQRDRAARRDRRLAGRHAAHSRRLAARRAYRLVDRAGVRDRRGAGACHLAVRRRRLRRQDACGSTRCSPRRRRSWPGGRCGSCCRARASTASSAGGRRPSSAWRSARRPRRQARRADPHGHDAEDLGTTCCPSRSSCRRAAPMPPRASSSMCRRSQLDMLGQHLHARAGRIGRHLRAGMRARRAGRRSSGMDPIELRLRNEPEKDPTSGRPSRRATSSRPSAPAPSGSAGTGATRRPAPRREGEWLVGMGCATATYPYYRMPGGAARITLTRDGHATVDIAAHEMGMGTATVQTQVAAERLGLPLEASGLQLWRFHSARRRAGRRLAADGRRSAPRSSRRTASWWRSCSSSPATTRRSRGSSPTRSEPRRRPVQARRARPARRATPRSWHARSARRSAVEARPPPPLETHALVDALPRRDVLRGPRQRGHRRDRVSAASSARSTAAASSTPRPRPASSAAASSWGSGSR